MTTLDIELWLLEDKLANYLLGKATKAEVQAQKRKVAFERTKTMPID